MGVESVLGKMRGSGYKVTPQRVAVLKALASEQHQSLDEIRSRCPGVGMVTVYRTLDLLGSLGLVRRLDLGDGARYEIAEDHHHHMICESCGDISEFEECPLDSTRIPTQNQGFEVRSHSVEVYGVCGSCK